MTPTRRTIVLLLAAVVGGASLDLTLTHAATFSIEGSLRAALAAVRAGDMAEVAIRAKEVWAAACAQLDNEDRPNPLDGNDAPVCDWVYVMPPDAAPLPTPSPIR